MATNRAAALVDRVDRWQQRRPVPAFLLAIVRRYREDRGRQYGALLSYYGFVSLFPLLVAMTTVLGIVLDDNPTLRDRILDTVYERIPVIGEQLRDDSASLSSSGWLLAASLLVTIWSGLGVVRIAQDALNLQWGVPRFRHPRFVMRQLRGLAALAIVGVGIVVATAATSLAAFLPDLPRSGRLLGAAVAVGLNVAGLVVGFRILVSANVSWRALVPGAVMGGIALWALQLIGGNYVSRVILGASDVFGVFATTFGLLVWIALVARATLLANEINVIRAKQLWPRGLVADRPTEADRRAYEESMRREAFLSDRPEPGSAQRN